MTDTERTEREIVEELKKRLIPEVVVNWSDREPPFENHVAAYLRLSFAGISLKKISDDYDSVEQLLAAVRSLPLPAEQESSDQLFYDKLAGVLGMNPENTDRPTIVAAAHLRIKRLESESDSAAIGEVIREARIACHVGPKEFAEQIGMLPSRLSEIQQTGKATLGELASIAVNLRISREWYATYIQDELVRRTTACELAEIVKRMSLRLWNHESTCEATHGYKCDCGLKELHDEANRIIVEHPELPWKGKEAGDA